MPKLTTFLLCLAATLTAGYSQTSGNASMTASQGSGSSSSPFGVPLLGGERPKGAKTEITASKEATFDNATSIAEFQGSVVVKDPQFTLFCDRLKVTLNKDRKGLELVEAFGKVVIVQESPAEGGGAPVKSIGRAEKVVYTPATGQAVLSIWPQVQHGINNQVATEQGTIMKLNRDGKSETIGGSKTVITDTGTSTF